MKIKMEDRCEFVGQIIDIFEDFLEERGVSFPETRQMMIDAGCSEEEADENDVIIYGDYYGELQSQIEQMLAHWDLLEE